MVNIYERTSSDVEGYTRMKHEMIAMRDGVKLCADIFLPFSAFKNGDKVPVLCSMGPYGKDIHASSFGLPHTPIYANMYKQISPLGPDACFELCEPLIWVRMAFKSIHHLLMWNANSAKIMVMLSSELIPGALAVVKESLILSAWKDLKRSRTMLKVKVRDF